MFGAAKGAVSTAVDGLAAVLATAESVLGTGAAIGPAVMVTIPRDGFGVVGVCMHTYIYVQ